MEMTVEVHLVEAVVQEAVRRAMGEAVRPVEGEILLQEEARLAMEELPRLSSFPLAPPPPSQELFSFEPFF